jgi:adenylylsulfate kinase
MIDSRRRSIIKAVSWRILAFIALSWVVYLSTGSLAKTGLIAGLYQSLAVILFIAHDRMWNRIAWGKTNGLTIQMTGMSGAGKSTLSGIVAKSLRRKGFLVEVIDGDEYRENLCKDLGFSKEDRNTNIRRLSFVSKVLSRNKVISIIAAINPYEEVRQENKRKDDSLKTVYVKCDLDTLIQRDVKGLYAKAMLPDNDPDKIYNFTGISDPFEEPQEPDLIINTNKQNIQTCSRILEKFILKSV